MPLRWFISLLIFLLAVTGCELSPTIFRCESDQTCPLGLTCVPLDAGAYCLRVDAGIIPADSGFSDAGTAEAGTADAGCPFCDIGESCVANRCSVVPVCDTNWCWEFPLPQGNALRAGVKTKSGDVYWAGDREIVFRWSASAQTTSHFYLNAPGDDRVENVVDLIDVETDGGSRTFSLGEFGTILEIKGTAVSRVRQPSQIVDARRLLARNNNGDLEFLVVGNRNDGSSGVARILPATAGSTFISIPNAVGLPIRDGEQLADGGLMIYGFGGSCLLGWGSNTCQMPQVITVRISRVHNGVIFGFQGLSGVISVGGLIDMIPFLPILDGYTFAPASYILATERGLSIKTPTNGTTPIMWIDDQPNLRRWLRLIPLDGSRVLALGEGGSTALISLASNPPIASLKSDRLVAHVTDLCGDGLNNTHATVSFRRSRSEDFSDKSNADFPMLKRQPNGSWRLNAPFANTATLNGIDQCYFVNENTLLTSGPFGILQLEPDAGLTAR
jgi:hypothetical protein